MISLFAIGAFGLPLLIAAVRGVDIIAWLMIVVFTALAVFIALVAVGGGRAPFWTISAVLWFIALLTSCINKSRRERADERRHSELIAAALRGK